MAEEFGLSTATAGYIGEGIRRVPRKTGGWLLLHASLLGGQAHGRVGVTVHPAREPEIATLIVEAYGLSTREREVTRLVLHGLSTREMALKLFVPPAGTEGKGRHRRGVEIAAT